MTDRQFLNRMLEAAAWASYVDGLTQLPFGDLDIWGDAWPS